MDIYIEYCTGDGIFYINKIGHIAIDGKLTLLSRMDIMSAFQTFGSKGIPRHSATFKLYNQRDVGRKQIGTLESDEPNNDCRKKRDKRYRIVITNGKTYVV
jgi:hypothetical protein